MGSLERSLTGNMMLLDGRDVDDYLILLADSEKSTTFGRIEADVQNKTSELRVRCLQPWGGKKAI